MDVFGLLCGMLFWGVVILAWIAYIKRGKPSKPVRYVGNGILAALVGAVGLLMLREEVNTRLFNAACGGDTAQVERLIAWGADVNYEEENLHETPLACADKYEHADTVKVLQRYHADFKRKSP